MWLVWCGYIFEFIWYYVLAIYTAVRIFIRMPGSFHRIISFCLRFIETNSYTALLTILSLSFVYLCTYDLALRIVCKLRIVTSRRWRHNSHRFRSINYNRTVQYSTNHTTTRYNATDADDNPIVKSPEHEVSWHVLCTEQLDVFDTVDWIMITFRRVLLCRIDTDLFLVPISTSFRACFVQMLSVRTAM